MQNIANEVTNVNINVKHEVHISKGTIFGLISIIIIIVITGYGFINLDLFKSDDSLLDISMNSNIYSYLAGESINYQVHISNMGTENRFDATIKYLIIDDSSNIITRKEETIAIETTASINRNIQLPTNTKPGKYTLSTIVEYGRNQQAKTSMEFVVVKITDINAINNKNYTASNSSISNNENNSEQLQESNADANNDNFNNNNVANTQQETTIQKETFGELLVQIKNNAKVNPKTTAKTCKDLESISKKDTCYSTVAEISSESEYCDYVTNIDSKDSCYLSFAMKGITQVCNKINDTNSKSFCEQLQIVKLMDQYYAENNTEKILELSKQFNPEIYNNPTTRTYEYTYTEIATGNIMDVATNSNN